MNDVFCFPLFGLICAWVSVIAAGTFLVAKTWSIQDYVLDMKDVSLWKRYIAALLLTVPPLFLLMLAVNFMFALHVCKG